MDAIEANNVPLSAVWVFDHSGQSKDWNITFDNRRSYMLKQIAEADKRIRIKPKTRPNAVKH
jgi:hypothetical protein